MMGHKDERKYPEKIQSILALNQESALAWDDTLYIIESLTRAESGKIGRRSYRDSDGILVADWRDTPNRVYAL